MKNVRGILIGTCLLLTAAPLVSFAQNTGFSNQQLGLLFYQQQQLRQQQQRNQQRQLQAIQQQFTVERREAQRQQIIQQRQFEQFLLGADPRDPNTRQDDISRSTRGTAVFGDPHFNSSLFMRTSPYYDYAFIARRNRPVPIGINANANAINSGGTIIFGNFGFAVPQY